jgi:chemotaxis protein histidine kinase CheA
LLRGLVAGFVGEAQELSQRVTLDLLDLERDAAPEALLKAYDRLGRQLHTLKGSAASLGLTDVADIAHKMEDAVAPLRAAAAPMPRALVDGLLQGMDVFMSRLKGHAEGEEDDRLPDPSNVLAMLEAAMRGMPAPEAAAAGAPASGTPATPGAAPAAPASPALALPSLDEPVIDEPSLAETTWRVTGTQVSGLMREVERLREVRLRLEERRRELDRALAGVTRLALPSETAEVRGQLMGLGRQLEADAAEATDLAESLEEGLRAITTLPVRTVLEPMQRMVRDVAHSLGKEARLSVVGGEVSLDRRLLERIKGCLVHLLRNAVDHGLEMPDVREARGKHREGALFARVEQQGNLLSLELSDDGGGLNLPRIRQVAVERGVVTAQQAAAMTDYEAGQLIFRAGFSTRAEVTELSGRGVGLDAVRTAIEAVQGRLEVQTTPGQGTRFILTVPLELGSSPVVVARAADGVVGLPMLAVESMQLAEAALLHVTRSRIQLSYAGGLVPLVDLGALMGLRAPQPPAEGQPLLVVQSGGRRIAVAVDEIVGDRDLVIRPLPQEVRDVPAYQGAATLSRGELMLVLRADWLTHQQGSAAAGGETVGGRAQSALVVDDSLTARALHRAMLEAGGFAVHLAASASQALERLSKSAYDVVVCDLDMDGMDGVELCRTLRARPGGASQPFILVSAHDAAEDRSRAASAGSDGFLSKRECASGRLLEEVRRVMARRRGAA